MGRTWGSYWACPVGVGRQVAGLPWGLETCVLVGKGPLLSGSLQRVGQQLGAGWEGGEGASGLPGITPPPSSLEATSWKGSQTATGQEPSVLGSPLPRQCGYLLVLRRRKMETETEPSAGYESSVLALAWDPPASRQGGGLPPRAAPPGPVPLCCGQLAGAVPRGPAWMAEAPPRPALSPCRRDEAWAPRLNAAPCPAPTDVRSPPISFHRRSFRSPSTDAGL